MSYSVKKHIAECYRRADEYKILYDRASTLDERDIFFSTTLQFLRLAESLKKEVEQECRDRASAIAASRAAPGG
jgi:hypothetical protein